MSEEEALEKLAEEYIAQGKLESLDRIADELYGCTYRSLSPFGRERIANLIGVTTTTDKEIEMMVRLAAERDEGKRLQAQLDEALERVEELEIDLFDMEMENNRLRSRRK